MWSTYKHIWHKPNLEKCLSLLVAAIGFSWQMLIVSRIYFAYLTTAEISIVKTMHLMPPAISVCFPWYQLSDQVRFDAKSELTVWQNMKLIPDVEMVLSKRVRRSKKSNRTRFADISSSKTKATPFIKGTEACYRMGNIEPNEKDLILDYKNIINGYKPGLILGSRFRTVSANITRYSVYLHYARRYPRSRGDFPLRHLLNSADTYLFISYARIESYLLPEPYVTKCRNYHLNGYDSAHHKFEQCVSKRSQDILNGVPFITTKTRVTNETIINKYQVVTNNSIRDHIRSIVAHCDELTKPPDCARYEYLPRLVSQMSSTRFAIQLIIPNEPDVSILFQVKMNFAEYLTYTFSCLSFWFGISVLKLTNQLRKHLHKTI